MSSLSFNFNNNQNYPDNNPEKDHFSLALEKIKGKNRLFHYTEMDLEDRFPEFPKSDQFAIILRDKKGAIQTNRSLIWVDRNNRETIFLDAAGKLASFYKIDLERVKERIFPDTHFNESGQQKANIPKKGLLLPPVKVIQNRCLRSCDNQQLLTFIEGRLVKTKKADLSIPHKGAALYTNNEGYSIYSPFSERPRNISMREKLENLAVSNTILAGTRKNWDPVRLRTGKEPKFEQIGAKKSMLQTPSKAEVNACYFSYDQFIDSLVKMGVKPVSIRICSSLPILQFSQPIEVQGKPDGEWHPAVHIPFNEKTKELFQDLSSLEQAAKKLNMQVLQKDFTPLPDQTKAKNSGGFPFLSFIFSGYQAPKQDLIIVNRVVAKDVAQSNFHNIQNAENFDSQTIVLSSISHETQGFKLPDDPEVKKLLDDLKIQQSSWRIIENLGGEAYLVPNTSEDSLLHFSDLDIQNYSIHLTPLRPLSTRERGVALLSMNQTDSYFQYPHEILSLLLGGVNVMAYDNCGKGLSRGTNSKISLMEQIEAPYRYLVDVEGFTEEQILVKAQCASGPLGSELAKHHPQVSLFLDQVPNSYQEMVPQLYESYLGQFKNQQLAREQTTQRRLSIRLCDTLSNSKFAPKTVTQFLPEFDVSQNLKHHTGPKLFMLATKDEQGKGGDQLVPEAQRDQIVQSMGTSQACSAKPSVFMAIPGGSHITPWMTTPDLSTPVNAFLKKAKIGQPLFATKDQTEVDRLYYNLFNESYNHSLANPSQKKAMQLLKAAFLQGDENYIFSKIDAVCFELGKSYKVRVLEVVREASLAGNNQKETPVSRMCKQEIKGLCEYLEIKDHS